MKNICIVHNKDVEDWSSYITSSLNDALPDAKVFSILDNDLMLDKNVTLLQAANLLLLVLSPGLIVLLQTTDLNLATAPTTKRWVQAPNAEVALLFCGVEPSDLALEDMQRLPIGRRLPSVSDTELFSYKNIRELVASIVGKLAGDKKHTKRKKTGNNKKVNGHIKAVPSQVAAEGGTVISLIFVEPPQGETVVVHFPRDDTDECTKVDAVYHDDNVYSVVVPEHFAGEVTARVTDCGSDVGVIKLKFAPLYYDVITGMNQLYVSIIDRLLESASPRILQSAESVANLDKAMASTFDDENLRKTVAAQVFEKFVGIYAFSTSEIKHKLPTPMHLAAKWNLEQLAKKFLDLPDAKTTLMVSSVDDKTPAELARSRQNDNLRELLEKNSKETDEFEEIYQTYLQYDVSDHQTEITNLPPIPAYKKELPIPTREIYPKKIQAPDSYESGGLAAHTKLQEELIHIMEQVKEKKISQEDASILFKELKIREESHAANKKFLSKRNFQDYLKKKKVPTSTLR